MTTATTSPKAETKATWTTCPACTGHGLKADAPMDAPTPERLCEACEGLGSVPS